ncbi:probable peroxisomal membrane protein PEX13 [Ischnura elegans]|uniref:probable peroxisomal membrane protein PEX13 n=1 Tax=Ischnura elegans TaxID=197161 RepID=UPI001ED8A41C|nr:probable peroxisomal membrane protein PEX13 [Ischnura elegans]
MSAPTKPWEAAGVNLRSGVPSLSLQSSSTVPDVSVRAMSATPPPLPPRPVNVGARRATSNPGIVGGATMYRGYPSTSGYVSGYGGYGGYGGTYGMYGHGYGGYGGTYSGYPYGLQQNTDNRLVALAEERTRPAFESIESVVRAFGSVSFMLESTLGALHASFRAALGVADHLSHLRNILSALSIFRLLRWCIRQLHRLFGWRRQEAAFGGVWGEAAKAGGEGAPLSSSSQWPLQAFIGIVISGSYLAWRLLSYIVGPGGPEGLSPFKGEENEAWVLGRDPGCQLAIATFNFTATLEQELSFAAGDRLIIAPKARQPPDCREWVLAAQYRTARSSQNPPPSGQSGPRAIQLLACCGEAASPSSVPDGTTRRPVGRTATHTSTCNSRTTRSLWPARHADTCPAHSPLHSRCHGTKCHSG